MGKRTKFGKKALPDAENETGLFHLTLTHWGGERVGRDGTEEGTKTLQPFPRNWMALQWVF